MTLPSLLPNDFCIILNKDISLVTSEQQGSVPLSSDSAKKRPYWIARVVKRGDDGKFRLNWFAEKPDEEGTFLKTDFYFRETPEAIISFKKGLVSGEERDIYKTKDLGDIQSAIEAKRREGSQLIYGKGPKLEDIEKACELFTSMKQEYDNDDVSTEKDPSVGISDEESEIIKATKRKYRMNTQSPPLFKKTRPSIQALDTDLLSFRSQYWSKVSPKVGPLHQVSDDVINSMLTQKLTDKSREKVKEEVTKAHRIIPKHVSLEDGKYYISILNPHKLATEWTKPEKDAFEEALYKFSEHFDKVAKYIADKCNEGIERKSTSDCVQYFYDVFKISRSYKSWEKQEKARLQREERERFEKERIAIKEQRKKRKKRLQDVGIDPKVHNYHGGSITRSGKLCNALVKIRKAVADAELFDASHFQPQKASAFQTLADESHKLNVSGINPNTLNSLKGISDLSNEVETKILQKKPRDARTDNQLKNIQGLISNTNGRQIMPNAIKPQMQEVNSKVPEALKAAFVQQLGGNPMDPAQLAYITQLIHAQSQKAQNQLQQQQQQPQSASNQPVLNSEEPSSTSPQTSNNQTTSGLNTLQQQAAAQVQNAQLKNLQNLQNIAQAQAQAQQQAQLNLLAQMSKVASQQQQQQNQAQQQALQHLAQMQPQNNNMAQMRQMQLLQMLQARQQQNDMQNYLQLQQLGHLPQSMSMDQYMMLAGQQEQVNQHIKQLQLLQQINEGQRQQQQQSQRNNHAQSHSHGGSPNNGNLPQLQQNNGAFGQQHNLSALQELQQKAQLLRKQQMSNNMRQSATSENSSSQRQSASPDISEQLHQQYQVEKMKLQVTHQQEALVLQMRQMQELRNAGNNNNQRHMLLKKHDAEKKNLTQVQSGRQVALQVDYQQSIKLHSKDVNQRNEAQAALDQLKASQLKQQQQQLQQHQQLQQLQQLTNLQANFANNGTQDQSVKVEDQNNSSTPQPQAEASTTPQPNPLQVAQQQQQQQQNQQLGWMLDQLKTHNANVNLQQFHAYQQQMKALQQQLPQEHLAQIQQQLQNNLLQQHQQQQSQLAQQHNQAGVNALLLQAQARAQAQAQQMQALNMNLWAAQQQNRGQQILQQNQQALQQLSAQMNLRQLQQQQQQQQSNSQQGGSDQNSKNQTR